MLELSPARRAWSWPWEPTTTVSGLPPSAVVVGSGGSTAEAAAGRAAAAASAAARAAARELMRKEVDLSRSFGGEGERAAV